MMFAELTTVGQPPEIVAKVVAEFGESVAAVLNEQFEAGIWSKLEKQHFVDFLNGLLNRQGARFPDFDELYMRKAELDRKMADDDCQP